MLQLTIACDHCRYLRFITYTEVDLRLMVLSTQNRLLCSQYGKFVRNLKSIQTSALVSIGLVIIFELMFVQVCLLSHSVLADLVR